MKVLAFGEVLWDMLPSGKQIGGAPGNFAYHAGLLGADARIVSAIGRDTLGDEILTTFGERGLMTDFIGIDPDHPTGTVEVELDRFGQPAYRINEGVAWDSIRPSDSAMEFARGAAAVCFGSLAARSVGNRRALFELLAVVAPDALRVFDLNLRSPFYTGSVVDELMTQCDVFKLNDTELVELPHLIYLKWEENGLWCSVGSRSSVVEPRGRGQNLPARNIANPLGTPIFAPSDTLGPFRLTETGRGLIRQIFAQYPIRFLILTCGARGSFLFDQAGNESFAPAVEMPIVSTVGAGDAFTAVSVTGFLAGESLAAINARASRYAAFVCTQPGGMPDMPNLMKSTRKT